MHRKTILDIVENVFWPLVFIVGLINKRRKVKGEAIQSRARDYGKDSM